MEPRDTQRVSTARIRKPPHTTRAMRQSIMMAMVPPDRMPLPPLKWNMQGNMWPSRQKVPAQYLPYTTAMASWFQKPPSQYRATRIPTHTATTALSTSVRMTAKVSGPPKVR